MANYFMGQGKIYIATRDENGLTGSFVHVGDADQLVVDVNQNFDDIYESMSGKRQIAAHILTQTTYNVKMNLLEWSTDNLKKALYGSASGPVVAGTVTGESHVAYKGGSILLANPKVSSVVVKKGATTLVLDTDYSIESADHGMVKILSGSVTLTDGDSITVDYSYAGYSGKVQAAMTGVPKVSIRLAGVDVANGNAPVIVDLHKVALNMTKSIQFLDNKHGAFQLDGMLLQDTAKGVGESQFVTIVKV